MAQLQTVETTASVDDFIAGVENETRRNDAAALVKIMSDVTGLEPRMWGPAIIGFGRYTYRPTKKGGDYMPRVSFSPRKASTVIYVSRDDTTDELLGELGKCKHAGVCLHINKLGDVNPKALRKLVTYMWKRSLKNHPE